VVAGLEPACSYIVKACRKTLNMLERAKAEREHFYFSPRHVVDFCTFYELMPHTEDGPWVYMGTPYQVLEPHAIWQFMHIYGFRRRHTHTRLTLRAYIEEPRKNAKSGRAAIVALYELTSPGQIGPQVLIGAATEGQANRVYTPVKVLAGGVEPNPDTPALANMQIINERAEQLRSRFSLDVNNTRVSCRANGGFIMRMNSLGDHNDGWNPSCVVMEELHAQNRSIYEVLRSAFASRASALMYMITTAGRNASGLAWDVRNEAIDILEGRVESDTFFCAIYTVDDGDQKALWPKAGNDRAVFERLMQIANPMWGVSIDPIVIWDNFQEALRQPHMLAEFERTRANLWGRAASAIIRADDWEACKNPDTRIEEFEGMKAWLGVDLMNRNDMAAVGVVVPFDNKLALFGDYYIPELSPYFEHPKLGNLYRGWVDSGHLITTGGGLVDFDKIEDRVLELCQLLDVEMVLCDDMQANHLVNRLLKEGVKAAIFRKNELNCTASTDDISARAAISGPKQLMHNGHPILTWNVANVRAWRSTRGGLLPKKHDENSDDKIDGFDAVMMANAGRLHIKEMTRDKERPAPYLKRGILGTSYGDKHGPASTAGLPSTRPGTEER
jgi:phage terminase large subunit-like protein